MSVTGISAHDGTTQQTASYSPFGDRLITATGASTNRLKYTGREQDSDTGLYYYRARYYDPVIGRFVSEDPLGFKAGVNFYAYVRNNPTNAIDPSGTHDLFHHLQFGYSGSRAAGYSIWDSVARGIGTAWVDFRPGSQATNPTAAGVHFMAGLDTNGESVTPEIALKYSMTGLVQALKRGDYLEASHTVGDFTAGAHGITKVWNGKLSVNHVYQDTTPTEAQVQDGIENDRQIFMYERTNGLSAAQNGFLFSTADGGQIRMTNMTATIPTYQYVSGDGKTSYTGSACLCSVAPEAAGGFVLYPSKPNNSGTNFIYRKPQQ